MNAVAAKTPATRTLRRDRQLRERLLRTVERRGALFYSPRCPQCGGRVDIEAIEYSTRGTIKHSRGQCRTDGCLSWED